MRLFDHVNDEVFNILIEVHTYRIAEQGDPSIDERRQILDHVNSPLAPPSNVLQACYTSAC